MGQITDILEAMEFEVSHTKTKEGEFVSGDSDKGEEFSWQSCELCNSSLGGSRHQVNLIHRNNGKFDGYTEYMVCVDCMFVIEYGELPD